MLKAYAGTETLQIDIVRKAANGQINVLGFVFSNGVGL